MNKYAVLILPVALAAWAPVAAAQTVSPTWDAYRKHQEPASAPTAPPQQVTPAQAQPDYTAPAATYAPAQSSTDAPRGGFFLGAQAGKGWVYEGVDQNATSIDAGYRWQAGAVTQVGIEVASGRLSGTSDSDYIYSAVSYGSIGANARFNFGPDNPWFAIARLGYWAADGDGDEYSDVGGAYFGFGLGVDVNRHFNASLVYSSYIYADAYYDYYDEIELNRADTLMFGVEARF